MKFHGMDFNTSDWVLVQAPTLGTISPVSEHFIQRGVLLDRMKIMGLTDAFGGGVLWGPPLPLTGEDAPREANTPSASEPVDAILNRYRSLAVSVNDLKPGEELDMYLQWDSIAGADTFRYSPDLGLWQLGPRTVPTSDYIRLHLTCAGDPQLSHSVPYRGLHSACHEILRAARAGHERTDTVHAWTGSVVLAESRSYGDWQLDICCAGPASDGTLRLEKPAEQLPEGIRLLVAGSRSGPTEHGPEAIAEAVVEIEEVADWILQPDDVSNGLTWMDLRTGQLEILSVEDLEGLDLPARLRFTQPHVENRGAQPL